MKYPQKVLSLLLNFSLLAMLWQCANPIAPTGGPIDETPPGIDSARSTPNMQTNFRPRTIELTFDEWVKLDQAAQQVVISPPLQGYQVKLKGKTVVVDMGDQDTLRENVTYVIQFGEAVKDLTESNPAEDLRFVFSTGPYIDSLELSGQVVDAYTDEPVEGALVMLYDNLTDTAFQTLRPFYFGRTNEQGFFLISNIRADTYRLYALQDADANYRFNQTTESIAFQDTTITISADTAQAATLRIFQEKLTLQIQEVDSSVYGRVGLVFNRDPQQDLRLLTQAPYLRTRLQDTTFIWHRVSTPWSVVVESAADTILSDTLRIPAARPARAAARLDTLRLQPMTDKKTVPGKPLQLVFSRPLTAVDTSQWVLLKDTLLAPLPITAQVDSVKTNHVLVRRPWQSGARYSLRLQPGAIVDYWGVANRDTLLHTFVAEARDGYGDLNLNFSQADPGLTYTVLLRIEGKNPIAKMVLRGSTSYERRFNALAPGTYRLEIIADFNGNGLWDTGDFAAQRQPEKVLIRELDELRANWEVAAEVDLSVVQF